MTKQELEKGIRIFDLQRFLEKDTATISEYSAILIITDNQLILTENGHHGRDFHNDTLMDILKIIYEIPKQKHVFDWHENVRTIEEEYNFGNIWARISNENNEQVLWFIFPDVISQNQYELLAGFIQQAAPIITKCEEKAMHPYSIVGFRTPYGTYYGMDIAVKYASSIIGDTPFQKPDDSNNIVGKTIADFKIQKVSKKVKV